MHHNTNLLRGIQVSLPPWAVEMLDDLGDPVPSKIGSIDYPKDVPLALVNLLTTNPKEYIHTWRTHYRGRSRGALGNFDLWARTRALAALAESMLSDLDTQLNRVALQGDENLKSEIWEALLQFGLCGICDEAISASDFFDGIPDWVLDIIEIIQTMALYSKYAAHRLKEELSSYEAVGQLCGKLWEKCWARRDMFVDGNQLKRIMPDLPKRLRIHIRSILYTHLLMKGVEANSYSPEGHLYSRDLDLLCWFYRDDPWEERYDSLNAFAFASVLKHPSQMEAYVANNVVKPYGADAYLARVGVAMQSPSISEDWLASFLAAQRKVVARDAFVPHLTSSGFIPILCDLLEREYERQHWMADTHSVIVLSAFDLLKWITDKLPTNEGAALLIREHNIFRNIARGILTLSQTATNTETRAAIEICGIYSRVGQSLAMRSGKNLLRKDYNRNLRREWYPLLETLNQLPGPPDTRRKSKLMREAWMRMGKVGGGLDETKEREDYQRRATKLCSWRECRWHTDEPPNPPKICQGCGEARYCGKTCQSNDWKYGGHKRVCRRLKDTPHTVG